MREDLQEGLRKFRKFLMWVASFVIFGIITHNNNVEDSHVYNVGPIDTRKYSKAPYNYGNQPIKEVPPVDHTIRIKVVGGQQSTYRLYDVDMDFEEIMYQMGIDPEDIRDFIGD